MHFLKLAALAALPSVLAAPLTSTSPVPISLAKRDASGIVDSVNSISTALEALQQKVDAFQGGFANLQPALDVQKAATAVQDALENSISVTETTPPLSQPDSFTVGLTFLNFAPKVNTTIDALIAKKPDFDKVLGIFTIRKTVQKALETQRASSAELGAAVTEKLTADLAALAPQINAQIAEKLTQAVEVFKQQGKGIPLPPIPSFG